jgi:molybdopterin-binding protein
MKISARNQIQGTITDITKGATTSHVRLDVGGGAIITLRSPTSPSTR